MIDFCLENQIKVKTVPSVEDWYDGNFSVKQIKDINISDLLGRKPIELSNQKTKDEIENKTILVTGAAGSIGSEIVRQLAKLKPKKIILLDQAESPLYDLNQDLINLKTNLEIIIGDVTRKERMKKVFSYTSTKSCLSCSGI